MRWWDGREVVIRLDHGLSFLRTMGHVPWRFNDPSDRQVSAIRNIGGRVRQEAGTVVPLYIGGPA